MIVIEIKNVFKERRVEDILDIKPKLVAPVNGRVVNNNRVLDIIELDIKINMPTKDDIKLIEFNNTMVENKAVEDSKLINITEVNLKLNMLIGNIVLNKNRDTVVNKAIGVIDIKLSSINAGVTAFRINCSI